MSVGLVCECGVRSTSRPQLYVAYQIDPLSLSLVVEPLDQWS